MTTVENKNEISIPPKGSVELQIYYCRRCQTEIESVSPRCPLCGATMQTVSTIKSLGTLLMILGGFITAASGMFVLVSLVILLIADVPDKDKGVAFMILIFFGGGLIKGIALLFGGRAQAKSGKPM